MFGLRSVVVALGCFGVMYCLLSLAVVCGWRLLRHLGRGSAARLARVLFATRMFPLFTAALVTLTLAWPAFLLMESGTIDEDGGTLIFGLCTLLLIAVGLYRVCAARSTAARIVRSWIGRPEPLEAPVAAEVIRGDGVPPLLLYGIGEPRVLISNTALNLLTGTELQRALQHEVAHQRSWDNLKKLFCHAAPFPAMSGLEQAWQEAAEFAADDASVSSISEALDLAAALIKLSSLPVKAQPAFTTGLVDLTAIVQMRVKRLLAWKENSNPTARSSFWWYILPSLLLLPYSITHFHQALLFTHRATEWFIH